MNQRDLRHHEWLLKRTCSLSPRQVALAYGILCSGVLAVSAGFAASGIWFVFGFGLVEIAAVGVALYYYARHATDQERIALTDTCLLVERIDGGTVQTMTLDPCWTRVTVPTRRRTLIKLESKGVQIEVGAFVSETMRRCVAQEMRAVLGAGPRLP